MRLPAVDVCCGRERVSLRIFASDSPHSIVNYSPCQDMGARFVVIKGLAPDEREVGECDAEARVNVDGNQSRTLEKKLVRDGRG